jgi:hypothetical protein
MPRAGVADLPVAGEGGAVREPGMAVDEKLDRVLDYRSP